MGLFSFFSSGNSIKNTLKHGAVVIDVRTVHEYDQGRVPHSINIPADRLTASIERIRQMNKPVIFCSASDSRSSAATRLLKRNGVKEVYDGGNWEKVLKMLRTL